MEKCNPECLPHSNTPLYFPVYLKQYSKEVRDYSQVNYESCLPTYQAQFVEPLVEGEEYAGPDKVFFSFGKRNCWLWEDEYCLLEPILDKVEQMTIHFSHQLGVGPTQPIWDHDKPVAQLMEEGIEEFQHDLLSGYFRVFAVLRP